MSSLSQEDLDAGWDAPEVEPSAASAPEAAEATAHATTPPNSMTVDTTPAPLESLIVRSPPPATLDEANPEAVVAPAVEAGAVEVANESSPGQASEGAGPAVDSTKTAQPEQAELPTSESRVRAAESVIANDMPPDVESAPIDLGAESRPEALVSPGESEVAPSTATAEVQSQSGIEPFAPVPEKPQLLAQRGVETTTEPKEAAVATADSAPQSEPPDVVVGPGKPDDEVAVESTQANIEVAVESPQPNASQPAVAQAARHQSRPPTESALDEPMAVELASPSLAPSFVIQHWRSIGVAVAATLALVAGLLAIRSKHQANALQQRAPVTNAVPTKPEPLPVVAVEPSTRIGVAASATIGAPQPSRSAPPSGASPQAESFSDAFVKHAATVNSSWAEVKKRPRFSESSQPAKSASTAHATASDNPLDVLDKLEKARKAKKSSGK